MSINKNYYTDGTGTKCLIVKNITNALAESELYQTFCKHPYYTGTTVTAVGVGTTTFEVNVGVSTVPTFYVGLGSVQSAIIAPRLNNNSTS